MCGTQDQTWLSRLPGLPKRRIPAQAPGILLAVLVLIAGWFPQNLARAQEPASLEKQFEEAAQALAKVDSYTAVFHRIERVDGKLIPEETKTRCRSRPRSSIGMINLSRVTVSNISTSIPAWPIRTSIPTIPNIIFSKAQGLGFRQKDERQKNGETEDLRQDKITYDKIIALSGCAVFGRSNVRQPSCAETLTAAISRSGLLRPRRAHPGRTPRPRHASKLRLRTARRLVKSALL